MPSVIYSSGNILKIVKAIVVLVLVDHQVADPVSVADLLAAAAVELVGNSVSSPHFFGSSTLIT